MTRETRIGLLVGLLFIIMFGLILSELAGTDTQFPSPVLGRASSGGDDLPMVEESQGDFHARPVPPPMGDREPTMVVADGTIPAVVGPAGPDSRAFRVSLLAEQDLARRAPVADAARGVTRRPGADAGGTVRVVEARRIPPAGDRARVVAPRDAVVDKAADRGGARDGRVPAGTRAAGPKRYTVQPNDTLIKIARKVYGRDNWRQYKRIFDANRRTLKAEGVVRPGQVLVIPPLRDRPDAPVVFGPTLASDQFQPALRRLADDLGVPKAVDTRRPPDAVGPMAKSHRIYKVRPGDNLTKIARDMLRDGSQAAVRRILKANKGKIQNPNLLQVGVELVIPS